MDAPVPTLTGRFVRLEPLAEPHRDGLRAAADDHRIWRHMTLVARGPVFDDWFDTALAETMLEKRQAFAVRLLATDQLVGGTGYLDPTPKHRRVEIGGTWYRPELWGCVVNPECKLLLLTHAFEALGYNRVSFVTDVTNSRSQAALAKLGATREGVLRAHMITQGGRIRDSVLFSIVVSEWPAVKVRLAERVAAATIPVA